MVFYSFEFFCYFVRNFHAQIEYERNSGLNFFSLFLGLSQPVLAKNNTGKRFFNFSNFFRNFLARVEYERNSGVKFFSRFLGLSFRVLAKNNAGKKSFNFLNFFAIFFATFFTVWTMNGIRDYNFFLSFSASFNPFWIEIMLSLFRPISSSFG